MMPLLPQTDTPCKYGTAANGKTHDRDRVGIAIEHLFVFFIRFLAVPMATDDDISERPHLQTA